MSKTTRICVCRFNDHVVLKRADSGLLCPKKETFTVIKMIFPLNTSIWFGDVAMSDCGRLLIGGWSWLIHPSSGHKIISGFSAPLRSRKLRRKRWDASRFLRRCWDGADLLLRSICLIPSGKQTVCYWNGHRNSECSHETWWFSIVFCMFTRPGNQPKSSKMVGRAGWSF